MDSAVALAERLGCKVTVKRRHGELVFEHHSCVRALLVNGRRKDASLKLISFLGRIERDGVSAPNATEAPAGKSGDAAWSTGEAEASAPGGPDRTLALQETGLLAAHKR